MHCIHNIAVNISPIVIAKKNSICDMSGEREGMAL